MRAREQLKHFFMFFADKSKKVQHRGRRRRRHLTRVRGDHRPGFRRRGEPEPRGAGHGQLEDSHQKRPEIGIVDI